MRTRSFAVRLYVQLFFAAFLVAQSGLSQQRSIDRPNTSVTPQSPASEFYFADDRLTATMPGHAVELAQPVQIPIKVTGGKFSSVVVTQSVPDGRALENILDGIAVGSSQAKVVQADGETKIEIIPLQTGRVNLEIWVFFTDGGLARQTYQLNVVPCSIGLRTFLLNGAFRVAPIVLEDDERYRQLWLTPEVYYSSLKYPIYLHSCEGLKLSVLQSQTQPVVRLGDDCMVHGLRPGRATLVANFDGVEDRVTVNVYSKDDHPLGYSRVEPKANTNSTALPLKVSDAAVATRLAWEALVTRYGPDDIETRQPFSATLANGVWHVKGFLCRDANGELVLGTCKKGRTEVDIRQSDGRTLRIVRAK